MLRRCGDLRFPEAFLAFFVPAARTLRRAVEEGGVALFTFPTHPRSWLSPYASRPLEFAFQFGVTVVLDIAWVTIGPFVELCGLAWALGTSDVPAALADGGRGWDE